MRSVPPVPLETIPMPEMSGTSGTETPIAANRQYVAGFVISPVPLVLAQTGTAGTPQRRYFARAPIPGRRAGMPHS